MARLTEEGFLYVAITEAMLSRAEAKANEMGQLNNSIRQGAGNIVGFLGEEVVRAALFETEEANTYDYDLVLNGMTLEVKTKDRTVPPKINYEASVANFNTSQTADQYVFVSLHRLGDKYVAGYVVGHYSKQSYIVDATFLKAGQIDPSNNWIVVTDCFNLSYSKLKKFKHV